MKSNRSRSSILTSMWSSLVGTFESRAFRRALGTILILANVVSSTGMVLAKESYDESSSDTSSYVIEESSETETNAISDSESPETSAPAEETSAPSDETSASSEETSNSSEDTSAITSTSEMSSDETSEETEVSSSDSSSGETSSESSKNTDPEVETSSTTSSQEGTTLAESSDSSETSEQTSDSTDAVAPETSDSTVLTYHGNNFTVIVTYGPETNIPSAAELQVREITSQSECDSYYDQLTNVMNSNAISSVRFFDISLVINGIECEPSQGTTVGVKILLDEAMDDEVSVVHIPDREDANIVETEYKTTSDGTEITFEADGFSAYAIISQEISGGDNRWITINDMNDVQTWLSKGIYIRSTVKDGTGYHYMSNRTTLVAARRYGITKTRYAYTTPELASFDPLYPAVPFYFEDFQLSADGTSGTCKLYCYADDGVTKLYIKESTVSGNNDAGSLTFGNADEASTFTVACTGTNTFTIKGAKFYFNEQGGSAWGGDDTPDGGKKSISEWKDATKLSFYSHNDYEDEPFGLDGKTYGLLNTKGGTGGRTLQATSSIAGNLDSNQISVVAKEGTNHQDKLYVTAEDGATMWTFRWSEDDKYFITAEVDGSEKYLTIDDSGLSMSDTPCKIRVVPQTGASGSQIALMRGANNLTFSGDASTGFNTNNGNDRWFYLVEERDLTLDYKKTYSAKKISVSDPQLTDGSKVIVYTRRWEYDSVKNTYGYKYYAIDHDGSLVLCYESGDYLQWTDDMINTLLWDFNIHYWEGTNEENDYYDLYNEYSQKYIAPQLTNSQVLSDEPIGLQLDGRKNGRYYSSIVAWDDPSYSYASLTTEPGSIKQGSFAEAEDFYFAIIQDNALVDIDLSPIETVDNNLYGIEMKMQNFDSKEQLCLFLENKNSVSDAHHMGILSTELGDDGYPTVMYGEKQSLGNLFDEQTTVNHLFINSTHEATGYFEYDSTQNFAALKGTDFTVYQELGTIDGKEVKATLQHGQFLPYNDLTDNLYAQKNALNLYDMNARPGNWDLGLLPDGDPRKYERLYLVQNPDHHFAMEMTASFIQTPSGLDDWGHDIIYEFTGDDDFWLYVDGELVIDLGGCHSAMAGSINFATGTVIVNGYETDLRTIFYNNYLNRDGHTAAEAEAYVDRLFVPNTSIFRDYTTHKMKMFYFERGGGASNLHMKFNQSSVTPGKVVLGKSVTGVDEMDSVMAEFPYQIFYEMKDDQGIVREYPLTNSSGNFSVCYRGTNDPVSFVPSQQIDGVTYENVFFLKPGEECEISFPDKTIDYRVVECGVNPNIYSKVLVNGVEISPTETAAYSNGRHDYGIEKMSAEDRTNVEYVNEINPNALRTLNIQKKLYEEDGTTEIINSDARFDFRLYLSGEYDNAIPTISPSNDDLAYMYNYHVKNRDGEYCRWDTGSGDFVSIGETDLSQLSPAVKKQITFQTSMYGAISKIPAGYTVEVRGLMVGSHYMVVERDNEIPDGYSRREYDYYSDAESDTKTSYSVDPISQTMGNDFNPKIVVNNLKGYGLRVYKEWTDKDFMDSHADVFFAIYKKSGDTYILDTTRSDVVHCINNKSDTSYWYYEQLEPGLKLKDYEIREVKLTGNYTVSSTGVVTGYSTITPIENNGTINLSGRMTGATADASYDYTVTYEKGSLLDGSNIRVDKAINDRPGLGLTKTAWDGTTLLPNAEFTVTSEDGTFRKKFVSDENGKITKAFFVEGMTYHLSEIKTPIGYYCPTEEITVVYRNGEFEVTDTSGGDFGTTKVKSGDDTLLGIKNKTYKLSVYKIDAMDETPVEGAHFALHKQIKVGSITMFDYDPVPGFEDIVSGSDGLLAEVNERLAPGVYELRELSAPLGYLNMTHNVRFRVGDTGGITLVDTYSDVEVTSEDSADKSEKIFEMKIKNTSDSLQLTVSKTVTGNFGNRSEKFDFKVTFTDSNGVAFAGGTVKTRTPSGTVELIQLDNTGSMTFQLAHGEEIRFALPADTIYTVTETSTDYKTTWKKNMETDREGRTATGTLDADCTIAYTNEKSGIIPTGLDFTVKAILGAGLILMIGAGAFAVVNRRRDDEDPDGDETSIKGIRRV